MRDRLGLSRCFTAGVLALGAVAGTARADQGCAADLDDDGTVGVTDMLILLGNWGDPGPGDLQPPSVVGTEDFLELLAEWGPCPAAANDECGQAITAVDGANPVSIKVSSPSLPDPPCAEPAEDVWYQYTAGAAGTVSVFATVDTFLEVYDSNTCPPAGPPVCAYAIDGVADFPVLPGDVLKIRLINVFDLPEGDELEGELFINFLAEAAPPGCTISMTATPASWLPEGRVPGSNAGDPGNALSFTVKVTAGEARKIRFYLEDVSSEPGVCMNFGTEPNTAKDLKFIQTATVNPAALFDAPSADGLTITTKEKVAAATVTVTCYDFGAFGRIRACCLKADNSDCEAHVAAQRIPVDANGNNVGDAAAQNVGPGTSKDPKDDNETAPAGDGTNGDNLSRYQEYRGFMVNGGHVRSSTPTKTVFIRNNVGNVNGASLGPSGDFTTDLLTAQVLAITSSELDGSNRINFNKGSHHIGDQKAVVATSGNGTGSCGGGAWGETAAPGGSKFVPNDIVYCRVCVGLIEGNVNTVDAAVAANGFPAGFTAYLPVANAPLAPPYALRTRIGNEVIEFTGSSYVATFLIGNHAAGAGELQVNSTTDMLPAGAVRIDNEFIQYSGLVQLQTTLTAALTANAAAIDVVSTAAFPLAGTVSVAQELIGYTGKTATTFTGLTRHLNGSDALNGGETWPNGTPVRTAKFTGLTRGAFGTAAAAHNHEAEAMQRCQTGLTRGVDGTAPGTHSGNEALKNFADANDKARQTLGHEAGHSVALIHVVNIKTIMEDGTPPCAFPNSGYWHVFINAAAGTNSIQGKLRIKP